MKFSVAVALGAFAASAVALPRTPYAQVLHEKREALPSSWVKRSKVSRDFKLPMRIGMTQSNLENGHDLLMEISDPKSARYGKHYTAEEIHDIFAPHQDTVDAVRQWLEEAGIPSDTITLSTNKQWLQFDASTEDVEALLNAEYSVYEHTKTGKGNIACDEYHVPAHIQHHIDYITPGIKLFAAGSEMKRASTPHQKRMAKLPPLLKELPEAIRNKISLPGKAAAACDSAVTPQCIFQMYNITAGTKAAAGNQLGVFEDLGDVYDQADMDLFFKNVYPTIPTGTYPKLEGVDGAVAPFPQASAGAESLLDFQISYPIIWPQTEILFQTDDMYYEENYSYEGFLNNFLDAIDGSYCNYTAFGITGNSDGLDPVYPDPNTGGYKGQLQCGVYKPTNVISISYGGQEYDLSAAYQQRQCNEYMKLGMQGISVLVASGDNGVAGPKLDDSLNGCLMKGKVFSPDFPASCPYITSVGATYLPTGASAANDAEVAVSRFGSGGGFSNIYPIPSYQASAVSHYFATSNPGYAYYSTSNGTNIGKNGGIYNRAGRGYPDVSAVGDNVVIYLKGKQSLIGGTSAATPAFAAILTRINEERIAAGKSTVGFVNPTLYANPDTLHDITSGSNPGCNTNGFSCAAGWDPVTGLGTPKYESLLSLFMSLP